MAGVPVADNAIQGPADLWYGAFGVTEPLATAINTDPGAGWTFVGGTVDGCTWAVKDEYAAMNFDQVAERIGSRRTSREVSLKANLAEATLDILVPVLGGGTLTAEAGPPATEVYEPADDNAATQPTYRALLMDGWGPAGKRRRLVVRKVLNIDGFEGAYKKDGQFFYPTNFVGHWVSTTIKSFQVRDAV